MIKYHVIFDTEIMDVEVEYCETSLRIKETVADLCMQHDYQAPRRLQMSLSKRLKRSHPLEPTKSTNSSRILALHSRLSHYLARLSISCRFIGVRCLLNLPNHELECLDNVLIISSASLSPGALELVRELLAFLRGNLPLLWSQVLLVTDDDYRDPFCTLSDG